VFDVGAHYGVYALFFAQKVIPTGKVYAFEPVPETFAYLQENIFLNNDTNIVSIPFVLLDRKGSTKISIVDQSCSMFHLLTN